jgi:hypothetical protein
VGCRRERGEWGSGALTCGPGQNSARRRGLKPVQNYSNGSNEIQIPPNLDWFKRYIPLLQKFEIKYGWKEFEIRNNFCYKGLLRVKINFDLKFRESSMTQNSIEIHSKFLKLWNLMTFS